MHELLTGMPTAHPLVEWSLLTPEDGDALQVLLEQIEESEGVPYRTTRAEVDAMFGRSARWVGVAGYHRGDRSSEADRPMLAFGYVGLARDGSREAFCQGGVASHARQAGLGMALVEWQTRVGKELLSTLPGDKPAILTHTVPAKMHDFLKGLEALGFQRRRTDAELHVSLDKWRTYDGFPPYLEIVPWTADLDDAARRAFNATTAEIGQEAHVSIEEWAQINEAINRDWSYLALSREGDRPRVVGLISANSFEQDWEALGWKEGVVQMIAAFRVESRNATLAALLDASLAAQREAQIDKVSIMIDPTEDDSLMQLYVNLGFEVSAWYHTYAIAFPVQSGSSPAEV